jgi:hypothetical protein
MNAFPTYCVYNDATNKMIPGSVYLYNPEKCIILAKSLHEIFKDTHYSVQDCTANSFTKTVYNTDTDYNPNYGIA